MSTAEPLLELTGVRKVYTRGPHQVSALRGIDLAIEWGGSHGLVGESGCGKTTTAKLAVGLEAPTEGTVRFDGVDVRSGRGRVARERGSRVQFLFQDPYSSLNPRMRVADIIGEPLRIRDGRAERVRRDERVRECLHLVGLDESALSRFPHEFSGGQRQRIALARAISVRPVLLVLDEPTSGLDVSVQAQILNRLIDIRTAYGTAMLFVSHDLAVVRSICANVSIMYLGKIVETGRTDSVFSTPTHPYTQALMAASVEPDPAFERGRRRVLAGGEMPSQYAVPPGCSFHPRCHLLPRVTSDDGTTPTVCADSEPRLEPAAGGAQAACHFREKATAMWEPT